MRSRRTPIASIKSAFYVASHNMGHQPNSYCREAYIMPNTSRLAGRFFSVLISLVFAIALPHTAVAGEAVPSPAASPIRGIAALPSAHFAGWPVDRQYTLAALAPLFRLHAFDVSGPTLCQIVDTVYRADGTAAQGTIVIVWP